MHKNTNRKEHVESHAKSGFEDDPYFNEICRHPEHEPPNMLVIPEGMIYRHVCPGCGKTTILRSHGVTLAAAPEEIEDALRVIEGSKGYGMFVHRVQLP